MRRTYTSTTPVQFADLTRFETALEARGGVLVRRYAVSGVELAGRAAAGNTLLAEVFVDAKASQLTVVSPGWDLSHAAEFLQLAGANSVDDRMAEIRWAGSDGYESAALASWNPHEGRTLVFNRLGDRKALLPDIQKELGRDDLTASRLSPYSWSLDCGDTDETRMLGVLNRVAIAASSTPGLEMEVGFRCSTPSISASIPQLLSVGARLPSGVASFRSWRTFQNLDQLAHLLQDGSFDEIQLDPDSRIWAVGEEKPVEIGVRIARGTEYLTLCGEAPEVRIVARSLDLGVVESGRC